MLFSGSSLHWVDSVTGTPGPRPGRWHRPDHFGRARGVRELEVVNDFWYHAVWTAKKLRRGELFIGKSCRDNTMKRLLRQMSEWHARATHGWDYDTWHDGRFLDQWADPRAVAGLREAYAHYDEADVRRTLFATMDLFRWRDGEQGRGGIGSELSVDCQLKRGLSHLL